MERNTAVPEAFNAVMHFRESDDITLMKQVIADKPYRAGYGNVAAAWDSLTQLLVKQAKNGLVEFRPIAISGKGCQARFKRLLSKHRMSTRESDKTSETSEEESELHRLLDEAQADYRSYKKESKKRKSAQANEEKEKLVRDISHDVGEIQSYNFTGCIFNRSTSRR